MSESRRFFTDTNLLIYALDSSQGAKYELAREWLVTLWATGEGRLSWQVLHEFYANAIRKFKMAPVSTRRMVEELVRWGPVDTSLPLIQRAWQWADSAQLSYWDSLIVAAAEISECRWLLTEDLQHGQQFGGVTVVNPFLATPGQFGLSVPQ